jgi:hypothetical protein
LVEAIKNLCGVSVLSSKEYHEYEEFNLRKFQSMVVGSSTVESSKAKKEDEDSESEEVAEPVDRTDDNNIDEDD